MIISDGLKVVFIRPVHVPQDVPLVHPLLQHHLGLVPPKVLVVLNQLRQHLQPVSVLLELRVVQRLNLVLDTKVELGKGQLY